VPVVLSDSWVLPFNEIIDWTQAAIVADEKMLMQLPETLKALQATKVAQMSHRARALWKMHFHSVSTIVQRTLEV